LDPELRVDWKIDQDAIAGVNISGGSPGPCSGNAAEKYSSDRGWNTSPVYAELWQACLFPGG
jgi:hypothetical protein